MRVLLLIFGAMLYLWVASGQVMSQTQMRPICQERKALIDFLLKTYGENAVAGGLIQGGNGAWLQLFRTPNQKTWTLVVHRPDGLSCVTVVGSNWTWVGPPPIDRKELNL